MPTTTLRGTPRKRSTIRSIEKSIEKPIKKKLKPKRRVKQIKYFGTWIGAKTYLRLPGIGRIFPGKEIKISEEQARAFEPLKEWRIRREYEYEEIN